MLTFPCSEMSDSQEITGYNGSETQCFDEDIKKAEKGLNFMENSTLLSQLNDRGVAKYGNARSYRNTPCPRYN